MRDYVSFCKTNYPGVPIVFAVYDAQEKTVPVMLKNTLIAGDYTLTGNKGNELAEELKVDKFVECSSGSGRGAGIFFHEIVYGGLRQLKGEDELLTVYVKFSK